MTSPKTVCRSCGGKMVSSKTGAQCILCGQYFGAEHFHAEGAEAMSAQTEIVTSHIKMMTLRTIAAYGVSAVFAIISALIVIFAPDSRNTAANLFAGAFLVLALGIAGFTRFSVKAPGVELTGRGGKQK